MADGCVTEREVILVLQARDAGHVRSFLGLLGCSDRPLAVVERNRGVRAAIGSVALARQLAGYGLLAGCKGSHPLSRELSESPDFWRGLVDGDGSIRFSGATRIPKLDVVGHPGIIRQLATFLGSVLPDGDEPAPYAHSQSDQVLMLGAGGRRAKAVVGALYHPALVDALPRKLAVAREVMRWEPQVMSRYPWDDWIDAGTVILERGPDYADAWRVWERGRKMAAAHGVRLLVVDRGASLELRFEEALPLGSRESGPRTRWIRDVA